jgi:hypothetical protein
LRIANISLSIILLVISAVNYVDAQAPTVVASHVRTESLTILIVLIGSSFLQVWQAETT